MADQKYAYTTVPGKLRDLLGAIPKMGVPEKATQKWMDGIGYRGGNAHTILPVLRFVGVIDKDGVPTDVWKALRRNDKTGRAAFAAAVRDAYSDLFAVYPDANRKDDEALRNFFRAHTTLGDKAQGNIVQSFKVVTEFGDFDAERLLEKPPSEKPPKHPVPPAPEHGLELGGGKGVSLSVAIQLQLPATSDGEVYEKLFAAMRKHLIDLTTPQP